MFLIVKLDAINSTNTYLKGWAKENTAVQWAVVVAKSQTAGKGQQNESWQSESGKNLTFSILYRFDNLPLSQQFHLNCAISLSLYDTLLPIIGKSLTVKWPNDIMSDNKKLGGILIENTVKKGNITQSVIGVGLNVNQINFPNDLPNATSLGMISKKTYDLDKLLQSILESVKRRFELLEMKKYDTLNKVYQKTLFRRNVLSQFSDGNKIFNGKIIKVTTAGKLQIELENKTVKEFYLKEIKYIL